MIELTEDRVRMLNEPLDSNSIKYKMERPYISGSTIIENANKIFGFGAWRVEPVGGYYIEQGTGEANAPRQYCQRARLYIYDTLVAEEVGTGVAYMHDPGRIPAELDSAIKGALTDAMKRCFRMFGAQFGSTLPDLAYAQAQERAAKAQGDTQAQERAAKAQGDTPPQGGQQGDTPCVACGKMKPARFDRCYDCNQAPAQANAGAQYAAANAPAQTQQGGTPCIDCNKAKPNTYPRCYDCNQAFKAARNTPPNAPQPPPNTPPNAPQPQYAYADNLGQYTPEGEYMPPAQGYGADGYYDTDGIGYNPPPPPVGHSPFTGVG